MLRGLYTSGVGMTTQMNRLAVVSNNIANADTTGFKKDFTVTRSFAEELNMRLDDMETILDQHASRTGRMSQGLFIDTVHTDFSSGNIRQTDNVLDLAITGEGFFSILVDGEERFTRDGSFTLTYDGRLVTKEGNAVNGLNGPLQLPEGETTINPNGEVYVNAEYIDTIKLINVDNPQSLRKIGDNLYNSTDETNITGFASSISQGALENSNVNPVTEMVEMIAITRNYEANQRLVTIHDSILGRAVSDIARK